MAFFKKREEDPMKQLFKNLSVSFSNIKTDIDQQKQWLQYLHEHHEELKQHHHAHKTNNEQQLQHVQRWIQFLHEFQQSQHKYVQSVEHSLRLAISSYNDHFAKVYQKLEALEKSMPQLDTEALKHSIKQELAEQVKVLQQSAPQVSLSASDSSVSAVVSRRLSNPEQKLLSLLFNEDHPLTYGQLFQKTGKNINTLRVTMNNLKKNNLVEENQLPNGVKVFAVANKEKIKKMYNLEVL